MIGRICRGWIAPEKADAYEELLKSEILPGIQERQIPGYRGVHLFRRDLGDEVEFVTLTWFDSIEVVQALAGEDYDEAVVPPKARELLSRFDERVQHYDVRAEISCFACFLPLSVNLDDAAEISSQDVTQDSLFLQLPVGHPSLVGSGT